MNLGLLALMCIMCAIGDAILGRRYYNENAYWAVFADRSGDNPNINPLVSFANAMITFQNMFVFLVAMQSDFADSFPPVFPFPSTSPSSLSNSRRLS